jgi:hypothetical protein
MGFIHATPGDMKSFKSSAERMALIVSGVWRVACGVVTASWGMTECPDEAWNMEQCNTTPKYAKPWRWSLEERSTQAITGA